MPTYHLKDQLDLIASGVNKERLEILHNLKLKEKCWWVGKHEYNIIRYDKERLDKTPEDVCTTGLFRSVVLENGNIKCFAPPKSHDPKSFIEAYPESECYAEEFIEGTMINVFYDESVEEDPILGKWIITTRSSVGAELSFFMNGKGESKTFREMFIDALRGNIERFNNSGYDACGSSRFENCNEALNNLPKCYSYSLVLQHPDNRIVTPIGIPSLYLVAIYSINNETKCVKSIDLKEANNWKWLEIPERYDGLTYTEMQEQWASENNNYESPGIVVRHKISGERTKFRNPHYERVRRLRGNQPKQQFRYLSLRQTAPDDIDSYLHYYPEEADSFTHYHKQVSDFTSKLHQCYMTCKVNKACDIKNVPYQYRNHVYQLHGEYIDKLRSGGGCVTRKVVENYVNGLPAPRLMYSINYHLGEKRQEQAIN